MARLPQRNWRTPSSLQLLASLIILMSGAFSNSAHAYDDKNSEIKTNAVYMQTAPKWVTANRIDRVVAHIQTLLEWDIHRINVTWYNDQASFEQAHGLGPTVLAFSKQSDNIVGLGPRVTNDNFDAIFGHELVHVIAFQKYHESIPKWLEEGLANYLAKADKVDYKFLKSQPFPSDVRDLTHPFNGSTEHIRYHYMASQALVEMIASKCDLSNLLRLSVGRKMDTYLTNYCEIPDLNAAFKKWVAAHG